MKDRKLLIKEFAFDPRMLISAPFTLCPKCNQLSFGILTIKKNYYEKRCKNCMFPNPQRNEHSFIVPLPTIYKKVIYLDQMAMSNMMKAINPSTKAHNTIEKIWLSLFEILDKLCKMQMIICPSSDTHYEESIVSPYYNSIKTMYNLLSGGIKFKNEFNLKVDQVLSSLDSFLEGKSFMLDSLKQELAFNDDINIWQDRIILTFDFDITDEQIESARKIRDEVSGDFNKVFEKWQKSNKTFNDFFEIENNATSEFILNDYFNFFKKNFSSSDEERSNNLFGSLNSQNILLFNVICSTIKKKIQDPVLLFKSACDFITSDNFKSIPINRIASYLFAGLARKAAQGQKRPPSKGMLNDFNVISYYLPFCDAMFLDNECLALLKENPARDYIKKFNTQLFSKNSIDNFFEYLQDIEKGTSPMHINKLKEVYGDNWDKPYTSLYDRGNK